MKLPKYVHVILLLLVLVAVSATPAFAQSNIQTAEPAQESIFEILQALFELIVALFVIAIGSERGTQLIKTFWNLIADKVAPYLNLKDQRAFILAAVVAFFFTYTWNVDLTQFLRLFDGFDAGLLKNINALLVFFASTQLHDKLS